MKGNVISDMKSIGNYRGIFSKNVKVFILVQGLNFLSLNMGNVFVSLFLINTSASFIGALFYNLFVGITILISFFILSPICKKHKRIGIQLGNALSCLLYITIIFLGNKVSSFVWILGIVSGFGQGFFWLSTNILVIDLTEYDNRKQYNSVSGMMTALSNMIGPLFASTVVAAFHDLKGYKILFAIIFCIMVLSFTLCFFIKPRIEVHEKFSIKKAYEKDDMSRFKFIQRISWKTSFRDGVIAFLFSILIFEITRSELVLGRVIAFKTIISLIIYNIIGRVKVKINYIYKLGTIFHIISIIILTVYLKNIYIIILFLAIQGIAIPLFSIAYGVITQDAMEFTDKDGEYICELSCIKELWIGVGRITGIILVIALYKLANGFSLLWIYGIAASIISGFSIRDLKTANNGN